MELKRRLHNKFGVTLYIKREAGNDNERERASTGEEKTSSDTLAHTHSNTHSISHIT